MGLEKERQVFELLDRAMDLEDAQLDDLLSGVAEDVASEVRQMLGDELTRTSDLAMPAIPESLTEPAVAWEPTTPSRDGRLGCYLLLESLGAGGMGEVYRASQEEPVKRQVAIKVLRISVPSPFLRRRLEEEKRVMECLDHPNVGKILDAGATDDGLPYIVMELIDGTPISRYCDEHRLTIDQRLRLFIDVCRGVGHTHGRLLLHRDIKPSNVLVTEVDGRPVPKLIDFGIAEALDASLAGSKNEHIVGTPSFMSPEALKGESLDTRTDVFSLGVLLHFLLVGKLPWDFDFETPSGYLENRLKATVRLPSLLVAAADTQCDPSLWLEDNRASWSKRLQGDLDSIVLKAIEPMPDERYGSVDDLAADIERYLAEEPVQAHPPSTVYFLRKSLRRHRTLALSSLFILLALLLGVIGTSMGFLRARDQTREAILARDEAHQVSEFMVGLFRAAGPGDRTANLAARELVDRGAASLDAELDDQPERRILLQRTLGEIYREWELYEQAEERITGARDRSAATGRASDELRDQLEMAALWRDQGRLAEARELAERALVASGSGAARVESLELLAGILRRLGDLEIAEQHLVEAVQARRTVSRTPPATLARSLITLGAVRLEARRWAAAADVLRQALTVLDTDPGTSEVLFATAAVHLAVAEIELGRTASAETLLLQVAEILAGHPERAQAAEDLEQLRRLRLTGLAESR